MCAHAVRVAVRKIDGVDSVRVSLNEGLATIRFKPDSRVGVEQVREAIRRNGFTPKGADITIRGRLVEQGGALALQVVPADRPYSLVAGSEADVLGRMRRTAVGRVVVVYGGVAETRRGAAVDTIQVRRFEIR